MPTVTLNIKAGKPTIKVEGIAGSGCQEATASLLSKLGTVESSEPTHEAFMEATNEQDNAASY